jgi:hypothetical protein
MKENNIWCGNSIPGRDVSTCSYLHIRWGKKKRCFFKNDGKNERATGFE